MLLVQSLRLLTLVWLWLVGLDQLLEVNGDKCGVRPVMHTIQSPGCTPLHIPSFSCTGYCHSYVQVSGSKMWQIERACKCCQESVHQEAKVTLHCPKAPPGSPKFRTVVTKAPVDCQCGPCTLVEEGEEKPQDVAGYLEDGTIDRASGFRAVPPSLVNF